MKKILPFTLATVLCCGSVLAENEKPNVYTVNYPLAYFTEQIGGNAINVVFPKIEGDPAFWNPDRETIEAYQKADLIILNGADYAKWVAKVSLPHAKILDPSRHFRDRLITVDEGPTHNHGPTGEHSHAGTAFTTWINPLFAIKQVEAIERALVKLLPEHKRRFQQRCIQLKQYLTEIDNELATLLAERGDQPLIASHPVYHYLAERYNLNLKNVVWEADQEITSDQWNELVELRKEHPAMVMIWENTPLESSRQRLENIGIQSITFAPCGNRPDDQTFIQVMRSNVENLRALPLPATR